MIDFSTSQFAEMKRAASERAAEILKQSFDGHCDTCRRTTWHYLVTEVAGQQIYRCAGCGADTAYVVQP